MAEPVTACCGANERIRVVDPSQYAAWDAIVAAHPQGGFFHSAAWARVLEQTYGHRPVYICRVAQREIRELLPVMEVSSRWTGRRGVSLPFTDFCPAIGSGSGAELLEIALEKGRERDWKSFEWRGRVESWDAKAPSLVFHSHVVELRVETDRLFGRMSESMRQGVRKAKSAGLKVEFSDTAEAMDVFYRLHCKTRRRHGLPPQPIRFFENITQHVIKKGLGLVATVRQGHKELASAVFFHFNQETIYKFGASDYAFQRLRPNNLLMWEAIRRYASVGYSRMHLGRTSMHRNGLRRFKLGLGAREERLEYRKYDFAKEALVGQVDRAEGWANPIFRRLPQPLLRLAGELLYPHLS